MGVFARLTLKLPYFTDDEGVLHMMDTSESLTEVVEASICHHDLTICSECAPQWADGYDNAGFRVIDPDGKVTDVPLSLFEMGD